MTRNDETGGARHESSGNDAFIDVFDQSEARAKEEEQRDKSSLKSRAQRAFEKVSDAVSEQMSGLLFYSQQMEKIAKSLDVYVEDARREAQHFMVPKTNRLGGRQFSYSVPIRGPRIFADPARIKNPQKSADIFEIVRQVRGVQAADYRGNPWF